MLRQAQSWLDEAELFGVLGRLRDLGAALVSVPNDP
jgi:hypothetical protein